MNETTARLIEQLAQKLGTTSEYLWRVLLKQAAIDATVHLFQFVILILVGWFLWKIHKRLMKKPADSKYCDTYYEEYGEVAAIPMILGGLVFVILLIFCVTNFSVIINGYFNPEYWALQKVLDSIG